MGPILIRPLQSAFPVLALLCAAAAAEGDDSPRNTVELIAGLDYAHAATSRAPWTDAGAGRLRYAEGETIGARLIAQYQRRLTPTLGLSAALDFDSADDNAIGLTEAALSWRPIPKSRTRHRVRIGAFYPPFSLENGATAWTSPFGLSFSSINSWLAEEIRPVGVEWHATRQIGGLGSRHQIGGFVAGFYGNDPAGTLLFWRGFALHDRQSRLNERIPLPTLMLTGAQGPVTIGRHLDPIAETDGAPGVYGGIEWRVAGRAIVQLARYDNRADPQSFRDGQWGWDTRFWHTAVQVQMPARFGFVSQWMQGATDWLTFTTATGARTASTELVRDRFDARFFTLTRQIGDRHRISARHDNFGFHRNGSITSDDGSADTISYAYTSERGLAVAIELIRVVSASDLGPLVYGVSAAATDRQVQVRFSRRWRQQH